MFFQQPNQAVTKLLKRKLTAAAVVAAFTASMAFAGAAGASSTYGTVTVTSGGSTYELQLLSVTYDASSNLQYWTYSVHCVSGKGVSHIVIEFNKIACDPPMSAIATAGFDEEGSGDSWELMPYTHPDPTTGKSGIKYDFGDSIERGETRQVWFALNGYWPVGTIDIAIKAAKVVTSGAVDGPDCISLAVPETQGPYVALAGMLVAFSLFAVVRKRRRQV